MFETRKFHPGSKSVCHNLVRWRGVKNISSLHQTLFDYLYCIVYNLQRLRRDQKIPLEIKIVVLKYFDISLRPNNVVPSSKYSYSTNLLKLAETRNFSPDSCKILPLAFVIGWKTRKLGPSSNAHTVIF